MVTRQLQVERRTGKVRRSKTDVLPTVPRIREGFVTMRYTNGRVYYTLVYKHAACHSNVVVCVLTRLLLYARYCGSDADAVVSDVFEEERPPSTGGPVTSVQQRNATSPLNLRHELVLPASSSSLSSSSQSPASLSSVISAHQRDDVTGHVTVKEGKVCFCRCV